VSGGNPADDDAFGVHDDGHVDGPEGQFAQDVFEQGSGLVVMVALLGELLHGERPSERPAGPARYGPPTDALL